jgi:4-methyl-5(b-hydroxyethyl)-thiazole monophosphate biosynthesis
VSKKAIVILAEGFEEIEAVTPIDILRRAGVQVTIAGLGDSLVTGARGLTIEADTRIESIKPEYDVCVLPGGTLGAKNLAASDSVKDLVVKMNAEHRVIAAICAAPALVLSAAGVLKNKCATCYPGMENNFGEGVKYEKANVVTDGNLITACGPAAALHFSLSIVEKVCGKDMRKKIEEAIVA